MSRPLITCVPPYSQEYTLMKSIIYWEFSHPHSNIQNEIKQSATYTSSLQSNIIYKYTCGVCNDTYKGSTAKTYRFRISQHLGISHRTSPRLATVVENTPRHHAEVSDYPISSSNFKIITKAPHTLDIRTLESLYMHTEPPSLNKDKFATKLNIVM